MSVLVSKIVLPISPIVEKVVTKMTHSKNDANQHFLPFISFAADVSKLPNWVHFECHKLDREPKKSGVSKFCRSKARLRILAQIWAKQSISHKNYSGSKRWSCGTSAHIQYTTPSHVWQLVVVARFESVWWPEQFSFLRGWISCAQLERLELRLGKISVEMALKECWL